MKQKSKTTIWKPLKSQQITKITYKNKPTYQTQNYATALNITQKNPKTLPLH